MVIIGGGKRKLANTIMTSKDDLQLLDLAKRNETEPTKIL
jgi:hypothetical protein